MTVLFNTDEIACINKCIGLYMANDLASVGGVGLRPHTKSRLFETVSQKLGALTALTMFTNQELVFIDAALRYSYNLLYDSDDIDLDFLARLTLRIESHLHS